MSTVASRENARTRLPTRAGVLRAADAVAAVVPPTPLLAMTVAGTTIHAKAESLQPTGAFKLRGAWWRLVSLSEDERARGVVAFSSGNHAQGIAWAAQRLGIAATIVMPADAPAIKLAATRALGAQVVLYDRTIESREAIAARIAAQSGATLVPSFDDAWVIEGQGSAGIEAVAQLAAIGAPAPDLPSPDLPSPDLPAPDLIVVPCGGGGLAAGLALACPDAEIVVVEPVGWDDMARSLAGGTIVPAVPGTPTSCDALMTGRVAQRTFDVLAARRARGVAVDEDAVHAAMRHAFTTLRLVLEPGGAVALAALLAGQVVPTARTLVLLSGGNVDPHLFARVLAAA